MQTQARTSERIDRRFAHNSQNKLYTSCAVMLVGA